MMKFCLFCLALLAASLSALKADEGPKSSPPLWVLSDQDSTLYLFGGFHVLPANTDWQSEAMRDALANTSITVLETDLSSPEALAELNKIIMANAFNPPGTTLSSILGDERAKAFFAAAEQVGVPSLYLENQRPWFALMNVAQLAMIRSGLNPVYGVEAALLKQGKQQGDSFRHLESAERQIQALISLEDEAMLENLDASMDEVVDFSGQFQAGLEAWLSGDLAALDKALLHDMRADSEQAFESIFLQRNREWVPKILALLAEDQDMFIAVGAGHLVGQGSLIDLLEQAGHTLKRL